MPPHFCTEQTGFLPPGLQNLNAPILIRAAELAVFIPLIYKPARQAIRLGLAWLEIIPLQKFHRESGKRRRH